MIEIKIYLLDRNKEMTDAWKKYFTEDEVEIVNADFSDFMDSHKDIDTVVSPANSFGLMDGGYDKAITDYFGKQLMNDVQKVIKKHWYGEQPVGTSLSVIIKDGRDARFSSEGVPMILIHTPSMRTPEVIKDPRIIYQCMRTTLIEAKTVGAMNIVIPAFGGLTGRVYCDTIAKMMKYAYDSIMNPPKELNWGYAMHVTKKLRDFN